MCVKGVIGPSPDMFAGDDRGAGGGKMYSDY